MWVGCPSLLKNVETHKSKLNIFHLQNAHFELQLQTDLGSCTCNIGRDACLKGRRKQRLGKWSSEIGLEPRRKIGAERELTPRVLCENRKRKEQSF